VADRWERMYGGARLLTRDGQAVGTVRPGRAAPGTWCGHLPGFLFGYFKTRKAAMRAVMVEAQSNKRVGPRPGASG
jgi:hypothetical protein